METLVLTVADIRTIVRHVGLDRLMAEAVARLNDAFAHFDPEATVVPTRAGFQYDSPALGLIEWMPCLRAGDSAHIKVVGYHPSNGESQGLPTILSTMSIYGVNDGHLRAVMDGTLITALRTGAASAIASSILAKPDSRTLGLIGAGAQAVTQLHALSRTFPLERVYVYDTNPETLASFGRRAASFDLGDIELVPTAPDLFLGEVDILCTATSVGIGAGPVFDDDRVQPHLHINAVGSDFPGKIELPQTLVHRSLVCPDFAAQALSEGECQMLAADEIGPELHALVQGRDTYEAERLRTTVFDSTGWALEDMVCMEMFMAYATELGAGQALQLESLSSDPRNPYQFLADSPADENPHTLQRVC